MPKGKVFERLQKKLEKKLYVSTNKKDLADEKLFNKVNKNFGCQTLKQIQSKYERHRTITERPLPTDPLELASIFYLLAQRCKELIQMFKKALPKNKIYAPEELTPNQLLLWAKTDFPEDVVIIEHTESPHARKFAWPRCMIRIYSTNAELFVPYFSKDSKNNADILKMWMRNSAPECPICLEDSKFGFLSFCCFQFYCEPCSLLFENKICALCQKQFKKNL
jgi:hypothetical protein